MSDLTIRGLYSLPGLAKLCKTEGLMLSEEGNRIVVCHIMSKVGVTVGQKIAQKLVQQCENGWGDEDFEVEAIRDRAVSEGIEYFLIKWKGWANAFNSWEPR